MAEASEGARLPWVAVYAWWRAAEALLSQGPTQRRSGIDAWRRAEVMARDLEATPILDEIVTLGRIARVERRQGRGRVGGDSRHPARPHPPGA